MPCWLLVATQTDKDSTEPQCSGFHYLWLEIGVPVEQRCDGEQEWLPEKVVSVSLRMMCSVTGTFLEIYCGKRHRYLIWTGQHWFIYRTVINILHYSLGSKYREWSSTRERHKLQGTCGPLPNWVPVDQWTGKNSVGSQLGACKGREGYLPPLFHRWKSCSAGGAIAEPTEPPLRIQTQVTILR